MRGLKNILLLISAFSVIVLLFSFFAEKTMADYLPPFPICNYNASPDGCDNASNWCLDGTCTSCSQGYLNCDQTQGCEIQGNTCPAPTSTPSPTPIQYIIQGTVYVDTDKNGEKDAKELAYEGEVNLILSGENKDNETITTNGYARLRTEGKYTLSLIVPQGYQATTNPVVGFNVPPNIEVNFGIAPTPTPVANFVWKVIYFCPTPTLTQGAPTPTLTQGAPTPTPTKTPAPTRPVPVCQNYDGGYCSVDKFGCQKGWKIVIGDYLGCNFDNNDGICCMPADVVTPTPVPANNVTLVLALNAQDVPITQDPLTVKLALYNLTTNTQVPGAPETQSFTKTPIPGKNYSANITLTNLQQNKYFIIARKDNMLAKAVFTVSKANETITVPVTTLVFGDVNGDNDINTLDYNIFRDCWKKTAADSCISSDFDNNKTIDQIDYNSWLRGFAAWMKQGK